MKKISLLVFLFLFWFFTPSVRAEEVRDFSETIRIGSDGDLFVSETIVYDFGQEKRHGIYRELPYEYERKGMSYKLRLSDIEVKDASGQDYEFSQSRSQGKLRLTIGDPDQLVSGQLTYIISYKVGRAINFFDKQDELYWNVTGTDWPADIRQTKVIVDLPALAAETETSLDCFSGLPGSETTCVSERFVYEGAGKVKQAVFIDDILPAGSGFTIVLGFPKGLVSEPTVFSRGAALLWDNLILLLPLLVAFGLYQLWRKEGRDARGRGVIVAQYEAPAYLSPMAVGTLLDERADNKDFSANLISLAVKGYLKIVSLEADSWFKRSDYAFVRLSGDQALAESETRVLMALFKDQYIEKDEEKLAKLAEVSGLSLPLTAVYLSDLKNSFYQDLRELKKEVYNELTAGGYFRGDPQITRTVFITIGIVVGFLALFFERFGLAWAIAFALSGLMIALASFFMPARTEKGVLAREHILGLKEYLSVAEAERLKFHNAPEKKPEVFEKLLPFAMVLGVEKEWAKQFEGFYENQSPAWYSGAPGQHFSALALADNLGGFSDKLSSTAASSPSSAGSGGSGFSGGGVGGGFGGGGGGSW